MAVAIETAQKGIQNGQTPFGCVIVKDRKILVQEHNRVWETTDITAHAEIVAIRSACKILNTISLKGLTLYSTCEPCPMCFSAIHWANIDKVYYGATIQDAKVCGFHELEISNFQMKKLGKSHVDIQGGILQDQSKELFQKWKQFNQSKLY
ncbi:MAG: nucleoside deaminase [Campylobacterales bacterium]|nr:nucleoside deaminase [Campylobacterales bacterium]